MSQILIITIIIIKLIDPKTVKSSDFVGAKIVRVSLEDVGFL